MFEIRSSVIFRVVVWEIQSSVLENELKVREVRSSVLGRELFECWIRFKRGHGSKSSTFEMLEVRNFKMLPRWHMSDGAGYPIKVPNVEMLVLQW